MIKELKRVSESAQTPEMDLESRTLKKVCFASRRLATDGCIIEVTGMDMTRFMTNPVVTAGHDGFCSGMTAPVIAKATSIERDNQEAYSSVQFADTEKGREYAYLYGLNPKKEVFMRAFSLEGSILSYRTIAFGEARTMLGSLWDEQTAELLRTRGYTVVSVADSFLFKSFAAVPVGADRGALSRAMSDGVKTAGELVVGMDVCEMRIALNAMRNDLCVSEINRINLQIQALARDGADAASRGDSSALLEAIRELTVQIKQK